MYGLKVHKAVIDACERESGITIHLVDEVYDNGKILFQSICYVNEDETPDTLASKIHLLEYRYFPETVENNQGQGERQKKKESTVISQSPYFLFKSICQIRYQAYSFFFFLIDNLRINLSCGNIFMS